MATDPNELVDQIDEQNRRTLQYGRKRFLWTWLAMGLLALLIGIALEVAVETAKRQNENVKLSADTANTKADANTASNEEITKYLKGEQGIPGVPGANGKDGTPGLPSSIPGPAGPTGAAGPTSTTPGPAGPAGADGSPSTVAGPLGPSGAPGTEGPPGPAGVQGPQGDKGVAGDKGEKGDTGPAGPAGSAGPAGPAGATGPAGPAAAAPTLTTTVALAASPNDTATHKQITVTCAAGRATGGGFALVPSDPGLDVSASSPVGNTGWSATADQLSLPPGTTWQLLVFAICTQIQ